MHFLKLPVEWQQYAGPASPPPAGAPPPVQNNTPPQLTTILPHFSGHYRDFFPWMRRRRRFHNFSFTSLLGKAQNYQCIWGWVRPPPPPPPWIRFLAQFKCILKKTAPISLNYSFNRNTIFLESSLQTDLE